MLRFSASRLCCRVVVQRGPISLSRTVPMLVTPVSRLSFKRGLSTQAPAAAVTAASETTTTAAVAEQVATALPTADAETTAALVDAVTAVTNPGLETSYSPVGIVVQLLESLHANSGLPWWGAIAISTVVIRFCMSPVMVIQMRNIGRMMLAKPEIEAVTRKYQNVKDDPNKSALLGAEMQAVFTKHRCSPIKSFGMMFVNAPVFLTFFLALRKIAPAIEDMKTGGLWWFTDLSVSDPYYILPILTGATFLATIELGADTGTPASSQAKLSRYLLRGLGVGMIPLTASFPAALLVYWLTNNTFSLIQSVVLRQKPVRQLLDLPDMAAMRAAAAASAPPSAASNSGSLNNLLGLGGGGGLKKAPPVFIPDTTFSLPPAHSGSAQKTKKKRLAAAAAANNNEKSA